MHIKQWRLACTAVLVIFCFAEANSASAFETSKFSGRNKREAFSKSCEYDQKGIALEEQGKFKEAIAQYKLAIATYPSYAVHYCNLGNALADLQRRIADAFAPFAESPAEEKFLAHVTLGRFQKFRRHKTEKLLHRALSFENHVFGEWHAQEVDLMRSETLSCGACHTTIASIALD